MVFGLAIYFLYNWLCPDETTLLGVGWALFAPQFLALWILHATHLSDTAVVVWCYVVIALFYGYIFLSFRLSPRSAFGGFVVGGLGFVAFLCIIYCNNDLPQLIQHISEFAFWPAYRVNDVLMNYAEPPIVRIPLEFLIQALWISAIFSGIHTFFDLFKSVKPVTNNSSQTFVADAGITVPEGVMPVDNMPPCSNIEQQSSIGWYVGVCTNTTVGLSANLLLAIHSTSGSSLHGDLRLSGDLKGDGPIHGTINSSGTFAFTTCIPASQIIIEWNGCISDREITGTYIVTCDLADVPSNLRRQSGVWSCLYVQSIVNPDPSRSNFVWVYNDKYLAGPISKAKFMQQIAAKEWPPKAYVAFDNCTSWTTIEQYLEKLQANEPSGN